MNMAYKRLILHDLFIPKPIAGKKGGMKNESKVF